MLVVGARPSARQCLPTSRTFRPLALSPLWGGGLKARSYNKGHMMKDLFNVSGKVALVTGGSRGIGEMIAEGFVANGVKTYISSRKAESCNATAARLSEQGECISIPADLSTAEGIAFLAGEHKEAGGASRHPGEQRRRNLGRAN